MLGSGRVCSGPVSWWCSEVLQCSPKVAPDLGPRSAPEPMSECEQCSIKFNLLRRRRECRNCGMLYCGTCLKRGVEGARWCNKCLVLSQWPLNLSEVMALRVKDLRQFLHSHHINTVTCTEKRELIDLVIRHISNQHRMTSIHHPHPPTAPQRPSSRTSNNSSKHKPPTRNPVAPQDDGIRVRPGSNGSMGSIRVRPMDSIRVRPGCPVSPNPNNDAGIRVFASEQHNNSQDTPTSTSPTSPASDTGYLEGEEYSHCPSDEWTASCCSLDSCHNVTSNQPHPCSHHVETSSQNSGEWVFLPEQSTSSGPRGDQESGDREISSSIHLPHTGVVVENGNPAEEIVDFPQPSAPLQPLSEQEEEQPSVPAPTLSSSSSASSSTPASAVSSPEPSKGVTAGIVGLGDLKSMEEIHQLSVRQCKELLTLHRVNYSGVREKSELFDKVKILWDDYRTSRQELENLPEELICKICMDSAIDCVLLECGHMVACTQCGKQMSECPLCRQYVVRVVRTFRA